MRAYLILTGLIVASVAASPASANWFSNPNIDINLNIGSAPNPTPDDVLVERQPMLVRDQVGAYVVRAHPGHNGIELPEVPLLQVGSAQEHDQWPKRCTTVAPDEPDSDCDNRRPHRQFREHGEARDRTYERRGADRRSLAKSSKS